jgi:hypothetical protein
MMFYCNPCGERNSWPTHTPVQSIGNCELCNKAGSCNDVPSRRLPDPIEPEIMKLRRALVSERATHLKAMDDAHPDYGSAWFTLQMARDDAVKQLKNEGLLPADYEETQS